MSLIAGSFVFTQVTPVSLTLGLFSSNSQNTSMYICSKLASNSGQWVCVLLLPLSFIFLYFLSVESLHSRPTKREVQDICCSKLTSVAMLEQRRWTQMHEAAGRKGNGWSFNKDHKERANTKEHQGKTTEEKEKTQPQDQGHSTDDSTKTKLKTGLEY